jgi:sulfate adenylyltransferase subunit 2
MGVTMTSDMTHLDRLEAESIHIMREVMADAAAPVMLYSVGKDSAVMLHLARKAFYPSPPPFPLLHVDTTWKFRAMYELRDRMAAESGMELIVYQNPEAKARGINPFDHGPLHTDMWKTEGLKQALDLHGFDVAFGGARRDEEKSRAKERIFSFRTASHGWDPKKQRPELWNLYNARKAKGESIRVFPISNWTELDIWQYIARENIPIVPLYFAAPRPTVERRRRALPSARGRSPRRPLDSLPHPGLLPAHRRGRERGHHIVRSHPGDAADHDVGAPGEGDRQGRRRRLDGEEEAGGVFLMTPHHIPFPVRPELVEGPSFLPEDKNGASTSSARTAFVCGVPQ